MSVTGVGARVVVTSYGRGRRGGAAGIGCATCGPPAHGNRAAIRLIYHTQRRPWYDSSLPPSDAILYYFEGKSLVYTLELYQKSDFQPSTIKLDKRGHPTVETGQIWPFGWF